MTDSRPLLMDKSFTTRLKKYLLIMFKNFRLYLLFLLVVISHQLYLYIPCLNIGLTCYSNEIFEKYYSFCLGILGLIFVVISINGNLAAIKGVSIINHYKNLIPRTPFKRWKTVSSTTSISFDIIEPKFKAYASTTKKPESLEELYERMNDLFKQHQEMLNQQGDSLKKMIDGTNTRINNASSDVSERAKDIERTIENVSIGSVDYQVVGALLVVYSAYITL